jgi:prepilin-type processing-associated H-X9-DG protein
VVALLGALLLPALARARERSRQVVCLSHLRQLGQAAALYHDDLQRLPVENTSGYVVWNGTRYLALGRLLPFGPALAPTLFCPSSRLFPVDASDTGLANLGQPGRTVAGSYYYRGRQDGAPIMLTGQLLALAADVFFAAPGRNHAGGVHVLFTDGSVRFQTLPAQWDIAGSNAWSQLDRGPVIAMW